jgi:hypothetical protein
MGRDSDTFLCRVPGAPGLDFETWESIDIDENTPYSTGAPLLVFKHF